MARKARGASPGNSRRQVPGWVWLFTGVVTGLFVAFLVHLAGIAPREGSERSVPPQAARETATQETAKEEEGGPTFDFYAVLPQMEVILPRREESDEEASADETAPPPETPGDRGETLEEGESYMLQAGSFRRSEDAEQRRAELILEGFDVRVQSVELDSGDHWHRVMIGPFGTTEDMRSAQEQLAEGGIEVLPIRAVSPEG